MPSKSQAQHAAMAAAAAGNSTLGIPAKVGREFLAADKKAGKYQGKKSPAKKRKTSKLARILSGS